VNLAGGRTPPARESQLSSRCALRRNKAPATAGSHCSRDCSRSFPLGSQNAHGDSIPEAIFHRDRLPQKPWQAGEDPAIRELLRPPPPIGIPGEEKAIHRVAAEGVSPEQAVDEAIARIKQILSE
jgi:hypothetical protein